MSPYILGIENKTLTISDKQYNIQPYQLSSKRPRKSKHRRRRKSALVQKITGY